MKKKKTKNPFEEVKFSSREYFPCRPPWKELSELEDLFLEYRAIVLCCFHNTKVQISVRYTWIPRWNGHEALNASMGRSDDESDDSRADSPADPLRETKAGTYLGNAISRQGPGW